MSLLKDILDSDQSKNFKTNPFIKPQDLTPQYPDTNSPNWSPYISLQN